MQDFPRCHYAFLQVGNAYCETLVKRMKALKTQCLRPGELTAERLIAAQCRLHFREDVTLGEMREAKWAGQRNARQRRKDKRLAKRARRSRV